MKLIYLKNFWKPNKTCENQYGANIHGSMLVLSCADGIKFSRNFTGALPPEIMNHENLGAFWRELQELVYTTQVNSTFRVTLWAASYSACVGYTKTIHLSVGESGGHLSPLR